MPNPWLRSPAPVERAEVVLSPLQERCQVACGAPWENRPLLVEVKLNAEAISQCMQRTGTAPDVQTVCVSHQCGALFHALQALAPLQELVR